MEYCTTAVATPSTGGTVMEETNTDTVEQIDASIHDKPALGIRVSSQTRSEAVVGAILRAHQHDHQVFVAHGRPTNEEAIQFAKQLGATVVELGGPRSNGSPPLFDITKAARGAGFPGLIWQTDATQRVDFETSTRAALESHKYVVDARERPAIASEPQVLVVIPAYNEGCTIADVVSEAQSHADKVLVIDDGSDDETATCAADAGASVIEHETNRGYGAALETAFCEADRSGAAHLVVLDGDGQHDPADIPRLIETQSERAAELVIGSRFVADGDTDVPRYRRVGLLMVNLLTNLSLGALRARSRVKDTQSGFRAYNRDAITSLAADGNISSHMGASTDILHHAHEHDFDMTEVGADIQYDVEEGSTRNPVQHGIMLVMNLVKTIERQRPISALGVPGFVAIFVGLGFGYWTVLNYAGTGTFPIGLALTSSFFGLAGIFAAFTAIILHSLNTQLPD